ncbi:hypothetical protein I352_00216 [Cryptococcus deuterogattii MMRL2647]|nr:hypothetical protein I352_00216 [Cryptococcus deuterogattii MMRL2647]
MSTPYFSFASAKNIIKRYLAGGEKDAVSVIVTNGDSTHKYLYNRTSKWCYNRRNASQLIGVLWKAIIEIRPGDSNWVSPEARAGHGKATMMTAPKKVAVKRVERRERWRGRKWVKRRGAIVHEGNEMRDGYRK